jgi:hypothetical protein
MGTLSPDMPDPDFPSGPWTGFYQYPDGTRGQQDLRLTFSLGRMTGTGADEVGQFIIEGFYDTATKEARWLKSYPGGHAIQYRGFREGPVKGIWGTWFIRDDWQGGFHIWPLEGRSTDEQRKAAEKLTKTGKQRLVRELEKLVRPE